jgi:hypothetical protein
MAISLSRCLAHSAKLRVPGNAQSFLRHNRTCLNPLGRDLNHVFKRAYTSHSQTLPPKKNDKYWSAYLYGGALSLLCLQQALATKKKPSQVEDANLVKLPQPNASISTDKYQSSFYNPIPPHIVQKMWGKSYKEGCPIPISDLAYVEVTHYNMEGEICRGELVVHKKIAQQTMEIFQDIFKARFPIEKMRLIDEYNADDDRSMEDNNSSAFCFRPNTNRPNVVSNHGLGLAIDLNTRLNPFVKGDKIAPSNARQFADRSLKMQGMIQSGDAVVTAFKKRGFTWGGDWTSLKDYQHFEFDRAKLGITV